MQEAKSTIPILEHPSSEILFLPKEHIVISCERLATNNGLDGLLKQHYALLKILNIELQRFEILFREVTDFPEGFESNEIKKIKTSLSHSVQVLESAWVLK